MHDLGQRNTHDKHDKGIKNSRQISNSVNYHIPKELTTSQHRNNNIPNLHRTNDLKKRAIKLHKTKRATVNTNKFNLGKKNSTSKILGKNGTKL